jgi:hypothetical protein
VALGYTLIADLVLVALWPKIRSSSFFAKAKDALIRRFPSLFGKTKYTLPDQLALPRPNDINASYVKTFEGPTKNLPSPYVIINGRLTKTSATGKASRRIEPIQTGQSGLKIDDIVNDLKVTESVKQRFAKHFLLSSPGQRMRHLAWFTSAVMINGATRYYGHKQQFLWMDDFQVLPQEEMDNYLAQASVLKLQCAASDFNSRVANRNYAILPAETYANDARELNALFNQFALMSVIAPTLMPKQKIKASLKSEDTQAHIVYDADLGVVAFQKVFENSTEVDSWPCSQLMKQNKATVLETSLSEAALDLGEAQHNILSGRLKSRWENNLETGALRAVDAIEVKATDISWDNTEIEFRKYELLVRELSETQARKMLVLPANRFNADLAELVNDFKTQGVYGNLPLLLALQIQIERQGLTGSIDSPKLLLTGAP